MSIGVPQWITADEGWGRKAVDFATLSEPGNCREYVAVHHSARPSSTAPPSSRPGSNCEMACPCGPRSTSCVTWPASPKRPDQGRGAGGT